MAAPTRVSYNTPSGNYTTNTSPKTTNSFDVQAGDLIVVIGSTEDTSSSLDTPSATGGSITWTLQRSVTTSSYSHIRLWTGVVGANATGITISVTRSGSNTHFWGFSATVYRNHGGVGVTNVANTTGAPSLALNGVQAESTLQAGVNDWNAVNGSSRTWRTVDGITPSAANLLETLYSFTSGRHTSYGAYWPDVASGNKTVGLSAPSGQKYSIVGIEILGVASGSEEFEGDASLSGMATSTADGFRGTSSGANRTGTGSITATGSRGRSAAAALAIAATLTSGGVVDKPSDASLQGTASMEASGEVTKSAGATLSGEGTLTSEGRVGASRDASLVGSGSLSATGIVGKSSSANLNGTGSLTASGEASSVGTSGADLAGTGSLVAAGVVAKSSSASLVGTGLLSAAGLTSAPSAGSASLDITVTLSATGVVGRTSPASLAGVATFDAAGSTTHSVGSIVVKRWIGGVWVTGSVRMWRSDAWT